MVSKSETSGAPNSRFVAFQVVSETGSTNKDMAIAAAQGAPEGSVLIAQRQNAGRGRQGRGWVNATGSLLAMSWLMRPKSLPETWGLVPLLTGLAVVGEAQSLGVPATLKWPNDVLVEGKKLCGILCESSLGANPAIVVGAGVNISWQPGSVPADIASKATSLGHHLDDPPGPIELARAILTRFELLWQNWHGLDGSNPATDQLLELYTGQCSTLQQAEITFTSGADLVTGRPIRVDKGGGLVLDTATGEQILTAGDAHHKPA